jgi:hypothetical protein
MNKQLKYRILEFKELNQLTFRSIATFCQVTERQVVNWSQIEIDSHTSIAGDSLRLLSQMFSCPMEELHTKEDLITA